jgi:hypothetical protein
LFHTTVPRELSIENEGDVGPMATLQVLVDSLRIVTRSFTSVPSG